MEDKTIVIDNGSGNIYAGFAEEENPISVFHNVVGNDSQFNFTKFEDADPYTVFCEEIRNGKLKIHRPVEHGLVQDWERMELVWNYTFNEILRTSPSEANLFLTEPLLSPKSHREKMAELFYEKFQVPALYVSYSAILPLYSAGLTTGVVLDIGEGVTQTVPVWGGYPLAEGMNKIDFGGKNVTQYFEKMIRDKGQPGRPFEVTQMIKERCCLVLEDAQSQVPENIATFTLPDGETLEIGPEAALCSEILFNPSIDQPSDKSGVHEMLYKTIMKTNMDIRKDLYSNIVFSGGVTMTQGFQHRVQKEIQALVPPKAKLKIKGDPDRNISTWRGGSVLGSLTSFSNLVVSKQEYQDVGVSLLHKNR